jgi:hypothetical protein
VASLRRLLGLHEHVWGPWRFRGRMGLGGYNDVPPPYVRECKVEGCQKMQFALTMPRENPDA